MTVTGQKEASRWIKLLTLLSLDISELAYDLLGIPIRDWGRLHEISDRLTNEPGWIDVVVRVHMGPIVDRYLQSISSAFGAAEASRFITWFFFVWNQINGVTWDWFAYEFAFGRWFGKYKSGSDFIVDFGDKSPTIHSLYDGICMTSRRQAKALEETWRSGAVSAHDAKVFELNGYTLIPNLEPGRDPDLIDVVSFVHGPIDSYHFQLFWPRLLETANPLTLKSISSDIEKSVKDETSYPAHRDLPSPYAMIPPPWSPGSRLNLPSTND